MNGEHDIHGVCFTWAGAAFLGWGMWCTGYSHRRWGRGCIINHV